VYYGQEVIEVTTFRSADTAAQETDETGRVLRDNVFGSHEDDASRRDFTINAMYYDPVANVVVDWHKGAADLKKKSLRMIGDPATRYREDPVRMLRAVRFAAKTGFAIDPKTQAPIAPMGDLLANVPPARLFDEMLKLFLSGHAVAAINQLRAQKLHEGLLPLLDIILSDPQGERFVMLALQRTDERIGLGKGVSPGFLFAALLWNEVRKDWARRLAKGAHRMPALFDAMDATLDAQADRLAITRRHAGDMKEIWALQPRFERRNGRHPFKLLEHMRYRAAYDFLLLRGEAGEAPVEGDGSLAELGDWWTRFAEASPDAQNDLLVQDRPREGGGKKRRRRVRGPRGDGGEAGANGAPAQGQGGSVAQGQGGAPSPSAEPAPRPAPRPAPAPASGAQA
jgi:poly(A) polymerase